MKNRIVCALLVAVLVGVVFTGCKGKRPDGMPELVPFKVKVVDGSTPIADVAVFFIADGNTVTKSYTYSNVKPDAEPDKVYAVGKALGGLFDNDMTGVVVVERTSLSEE